MCVLEPLKQAVYEANKIVAQLENGFTLLGSAASIDRESGYIVTRPSAILPSELCPEVMLVVKEDGTVVEGNGVPAKDFAAHRELFLAFPWINASIHAHSHYATCFAQAGRSIPPYGATHADSFHGEISCTRELTPREISNHYERHIGRLIADSYRYTSEQEIPGILVARHGAFAWGESCAQAVQHITALETAAHMAFDTEILNVKVTPAPSSLLEKHFYRRHKHIAEK